MRSQSILVVPILLLLLEYVSTAFATTSFQGLGRLGSGSQDYSTAYGVSGNGSVVVGVANDQPFRWTAESGIVLLENLPGGYYGGANAVSDNGQVVVGTSDIANGREACRWTAQEGAVGLGHMSKLYLDSKAFGVSADGSVIVGWGKGVSGYDTAFRWTTSGGMQELTTGNSASYAEGVSGDGSVVVGYRVNVDLNICEAFRWTEDTGMVGLGDLPGGDFYSGVNAISADGAVAVGFGSTSYGGSTEAFRWTEKDGMVGLGDLPGGAFDSTAYDVSGDGSVVVGGSVVEGPAWTKEAFIWEPDSAMRSLKDVLENDFGLNLTGWMLTEATAISTDGTTIVGRGFNPYGYSEAWIATIPEPTTFLLLGLGILALRRKR